MKEPKKVRLPKKLAVCAAAIAVFLVTGSVGVWAYNTPYSYVSLDVNPSIEYAVNRFDVVIDVTAVNDDGEAIISEISIDDLKNIPINEAITQTVNQIADNGYFESTTAGGVQTGTETGTQTDVSVVSGGGIVISTSSENQEKADELAGELQQTVEDQVAENGDAVEVEVISVGLERVQEARELGVTPGKLNLVEKLKASAADPDSIILEEWLEKPVREIMKATKENRKAAKAGEATTEETQEAVEAVTKEDTTAVIKEVKADDAKASNKETKVLEKAAKVSEKTAKEQSKASEKAVKEQSKVSEKVTKEQSKISEKAANTQAKFEEKSNKAENKTSDKIEKDKQKNENKANENAVKDNQNNSKAVKDNQNNSKAVKDINVGDTQATESSDKSGSNSAKESNNNGNSNNRNGKSNK